MDQDQDKSKQSAKRPVGRPVERPMPKPIPDTPENIARILMTTAPPEWTYKNEGGIQNRKGGDIDG